MASRADRRYSKSSDDQRSRFERDRDRILYSTAFRRLAGVTQVVRANEGHIFHNRLTHSLKVAQVGRRIAEHLIASQKKELIEAVGGIDATVVETASLAHDLGHPPFGHIAETELDSLLKLEDVQDGYEGNPQSLRIVTHVETAYAEHRGLDLTRASLCAIIKYPWPRAVSGKASKKWGFYSSEREDFKFARELFDRADERQSAEAAIMDWADDIAYSVHDIEDFYRAGLVPFAQLLRDSEERSRFTNAGISKLKADGKNTSASLLEAGLAEEMFKGLYQVAADLPTRFVRHRDEKIALRALTSFLVRRYVIGPQGIDPLTLTPADQEARIKVHPSLRAEVDLLKEVMRYYVYNNPAWVAQQYGHKRVIRELFEIFYEATHDGSKTADILPPPFSDDLGEIDRSQPSERARLVADLIASLNDSQALLVHQRLVGLDPGSVLDVIIQ